MEALIVVKWWLIHPLHDRVRNPFVSDGSARGFFSSVVRPNNYIYRPQTKLRKGNGFTPVCQSFCSRGDLPQCMLGYTTTTTSLGRHCPGRHPPGKIPSGQTPPWTDTPLGRHPSNRRLLLQTVRILLECILVASFFCNTQSWQCSHFCIV